MNTTGLRSVNGPATPKSIRLSVVLLAVIAGFFILTVTVAIKTFQVQDESKQPAPDATTSESANRRVFEHKSAQTGDATHLITTPSVNPRELIAKLDALGSLTAISDDGHEIEEWQSNLRQLIRNGSSSVPAIQDYLDLNKNARLPIGGFLDVDFPASLREALLQALIQIGGPDATAAMVHVLQTTIYPIDTLTLADSLQQQFPGQYTDEILSAARGQLAAIAALNPTEGDGAMLLYPVLAEQASQGADVVGDLTQYIVVWPYFSTIALANLPNGAGVPSLIQMAQESSGSVQTAAEESVAHLALNNPTALNALLTMAQQGQLTDSDLANIAPYLGGKENVLGPLGTMAGFGVPQEFPQGNPGYAVADFQDFQSAAQVTQEISVIEQFLQVIPPADTLAQQALLQRQGALIALQQRIAQTQFE